MSTIKNGGPAFPGEPNTQPGFYAHQGMSLRDYFASMAAAGLCANQEWMKNAHTRSGKDMDFCVSRAAYEVADAMLAAREVQP